MGTTLLTRWRGWIGGVLALVALGLPPAVIEPGLAGAPPQAQSDSCDLTAPGRIVAVGDVHGAFEPYTAILREAKLIDARQRWIGGNATLVQVGDVVDRGTESRRVLDFLRQLEPAARKAGGRVQLLLGNHEVMRMAGDWRYVTKADYEAFRSPDAGDLRERLYAEALKANEAAARAKGETFDAKQFRKDFLEKTELGAVEMQQAFSEKGEYGMWLRQHDIVARINGIVFVHAGPGRVYADRGCAGLNADARTELKGMTAPDPKKMLWSAEGPLWYRGLVGVEPAASADDVTAILKALGASRIVVGHTATKPGRIRQYQDGRVIAIDSGMLNGEMFPEGVPSALEIEHDTFTAIYMGKREVLIKPGQPAVRERPQPASR